MARYTIDFSTNASAIVKQIEEVNKRITELARTGSRKIELQIDTRGLRASFDSTFRELDAQIDKMQRRLSGLQIGSRRFQEQATAIGITQGLRERGSLQSRAIQLGAQAGAFDPGSIAQLQRQLEAARIEASQLTPNTQEWVNLQRQIGQINNQLKITDKLAESVQLTESLGAFNPKSLNFLEAKLTILRNRAREIAPNTSEWKQLNKEIVQLEGKIQKQTNPLTRGQRLGAAGGAFLYGGGLGGGAGSAIGGIAGGLAGGVPGAFTGAAIGQVVDNVAALAFAMTEQANAIKRLRLGLASASTDLRDFGVANKEIEAISNRLLIPLEETYRQFTQLRASTSALGIDTKTTSQIFEGIATSVLKTGGSMEDVQGAMRAVSQVFSKGKVTAEELRGQLGERLPGAVVKFAQKNNIAIQDLDKAFESGQVSVDQFVTFAKGLLEDSAGYSDELSTRQEYASMRYAKAVESMRIAIGRAVGPMLNDIQSFAAEAIKDILWLTGQLDAFAKFLEKRFGGGDADSTFLGEGPQNIADRLIGGDIEVKDLEDRTKFFESKIRESQAKLESIQAGRFKDNRNIFERFFGGPGEENLRQNLPNQVAYYKKQLDELIQAKKLAEKKLGGGTAGLVTSSSDPAAEQRASKFLGLVEQREDSIAQARQKYEEEIANIRENAIKQAESLERSFNDKRLQTEQEIARIRREIAASEAEQALVRRELASGVTGEDTDLIEQERQIGQIINDFTEEKISLEEQAQQEQINLSRELEDFKRKNADAINQANERYARAIGEIQKNYAKAVAKLIEDGSGNGAKKLAAAGKLIAALIAQVSAQQAFESLTGIPVQESQRGVQSGGREFTDKTQFGVATALGGLQRGYDTETIRAQRVAAENYFDAVVKARRAQQELNAAIGKTATITTAQVASVDLSDINKGVEESSEKLRNATEKLFEVKDVQSVNKAFDATLSLLRQQTEEGRKRKNNLEQENELILAQIDAIANGVLPELAEQEVTQERLYNKEASALKNNASLFEKSIDKIEDAKLREEARLQLLPLVSKELQNQLDILVEQQKQYEALARVSRDNAASLEAARIRGSIPNVGTGLRAGFLNEAGAAFEEQISRGVSREAAANVAKATEELTLAKFAADGLQDAANGVGDSFAQSFSDVITGAQNAQAALQQLFQNIAKSFADLAAQLIAKFLLLKAVGLIASFFNPGGGAGNSGGANEQGLIFDEATFDFVPVKKNANGGILAGGFRAFANGGVVNSPTLGLVGEGRFNEAVVPLPNGKSIPVDLGNGAGNNISTNIVVNVNNGQTSSQVNGAGGQALGRELEGAVRSVILKEARPGGIIYNAR